MTRWVLPFLLATSTAHAGKPTAAQANKALDAWIKALPPSDSKAPHRFDAAIKLTGTPFHVHAKDSSNAEGNCNVTVTDAAKLADGLACAVYVQDWQHMKPVTPKVLDDLWDDLRDDKAEITRLGKVDAIYYVQDDGEDQHNLTIVVLELGADKVARVVAVYAQAITT
ncbi:MAG TPA: hypothetical protein VGF94_13430 [Kofleriaceae bacterium]|jgi:hypothetical protein